jgi:hypothetical protein
MTKKAPTKPLAGAQMTAEQLLDLINALPLAERRKLARFLARHAEFWVDFVSVPDTNPLHKLYEELCLLLYEKERELEREFDRMRAELSDAQEEVADSIPKRKMTRRNKETLDHYYRLLQKHANERGGKMKALKELVTLPSEQCKGYVLTYKQSCRYDPDGIGEMEPVRQHVKRLRTTAKKRRR